MPDDQSPAILLMQANRIAFRKVLAAATPCLSGEQTVGMSPRCGSDRVNRMEPRLVPKC